jgi:Mor transcription activator family
VIEYLPQSLRDIASAIGFEGVMLLVERYGSQRLWIPAKPSHDWELFDILGRENAYKLVELCASNQIEIPKCKRLKIEMRNQKIRDDMRSLSISQLTKKYSLDRGHIRKICNAS